jgi:hypothetical protein
MAKNQGQPKKKPRAQWLDQMAPAVAKLRKKAVAMGAEWPPDDVINLLLYVALEPRKIDRAMFGDEWAKLYVKRPTFVLWFMHNIRQAALKMPPAQHWVCSAVHRNETDKDGKPLKDAAIADRIRKITGTKVATRSVESARRKFRITQRDTP